MVWLPLFAALAAEPPVSLGDAINVERHLVSEFLGKQVRFRKGDSLTRARFAAERAGVRLMVELYDSCPADCEWSEPWARHFRKTTVVDVTVTAAGAPRPSDLRDLLGPEARWQFRSVPVEGRSDVLQWIPTHVRKADGSWATVSPVLDTRVHLDLEAERARAMDGRGLLDLQEMVARLLRDEGIAVHPIGSSYNSGVTPEDLAGLSAAPTARELLLAGTADSKDWWELDWDGEVYRLAVYRSDVRGLHSPSALIEGGHARPVE
ncbi:MAG: hypothetical protein R3F61_24465 [Myxococcota bacterium]